MSSEAIGIPVRCVAVWEGRELNASLVNRSHQLTKSLGGSYLYAWMPVI